MKPAAPSVETQQEAMKIARATQTPGQTKEQTKLIAQGIEKGIAQYKKQQKERQRQASRSKKKLLKEKQRHADDITTESPSTLTQASPAKHANASLPWALLLISWLGFMGYITLV
ncbi:DUF2956 domain-containing protein [Vibrio sp. SM6]|uniref:DUF2956 domain-containing protein n=1 Tax=Vibrio agarilyticus TaxID=2726741 RepID=A0A7X8TS35_9VIBR|nr:DUF2956 domain-containing protein [Vibrio agarilyticus]NLS13213.1 DUF2956 domain-containing protein [Vibrio agarilyticus]